jgi:hypothetical protein
LNYPLSEAVTYLNYHSGGYFPAIVVDALISCMQSAVDTELKDLINLETEFLTPLRNIRNLGFKAKALFIDNNIVGFSRIIDWLNDNSNGQIRMNALCAFIETTDGAKWKSFKRHRSNMSRFSQLNNYYQLL